MALINVRLESDDLRRVKALRKAGVVVSDIVREAIRIAYDAQVDARSSRTKLSSIVAEILQELPDDETVPARQLDPRNRPALRSHIVKKLRRS